MRNCDAIVRPCIKVQLRPCHSHGLVLRLSHCYDADKLITSIINLVLIIIMDAIIFIILSIILLDIFKVILLTIFV